MLKYGFCLKDWTKIHGDDQAHDHGTVMVRKIPVHAPRTKLSL
jgi:hypothetical protein